MDVKLRNGSGPERSNQLTRENIEANALMRDTNDAKGFSLDDPGQWQVRLSDPAAAVYQRSRSRWCHDGPGEA